MIFKKKRLPVNASFTGWIAMSDTHWLHAAQSDAFRGIQCKKSELGSVVLQRKLVSTAHIQINRNATQELTGIWSGDSASK
jgi:hypothetical protein